MKNYVYVLIIVLSLLTATHFVNKTCSIISSQSQINHIYDGEYRITQESADFFLHISAPENMDYQKIVNISVEITEISGSPQNGISVKLELDPGLYFATGQNDIVDFGDFNPGEIKTANFSITASQTKLTSPYIIGKAYVFKNDIQQYISTPDNELEAYYTFGINIQYPNLRVRGPIELAGFVIPRIEMLPDEKQTVTYNVSNIGNSALRNLTFQVETEKDFIKTSVSKTSLDILPPNSSTFISIEISCETQFASISDLHFLVDSDLFDTRILVLKVQTFDFFNPYKYYNPLVIFAWPIFVLFFVGFALFIGFYSWRKHVRRKRIEKEFEERYGKSLIE
ncbi:MAG: hypothetical protein ACFFC6_11440 [Promethearchaeota archaeon]